MKTQRPVDFVKTFFAVCLLTIAAACAQVGVQAPATFSGKLAVGVATVTEIRTQTTTLLKLGAITPEDAQNVQTQADTARAGLDIARTLSGSDPKSAEFKLDAMNAVLGALQNYLVTKGTPK